MRFAAPLPKHYAPSSIEAMAYVTEMDLLDHVFAPEFASEVRDTFEAGSQEEAFDGLVAALTLHVSAAERAAALLAARVQGLSFTDSSEKKMREACAAAATRLPAPVRLEKRAFERAVEDETDPRQAAAEQFAYRAQRLTLQDIDTDNARDLVETLATEARSRWDAFFEAMRKAPRGFC